MDTLEQQIDWKQIAEIASEDLCSEATVNTGVELGCDDECMTCAGIMGARWALSVKKNLESCRSDTIKECRNAYEAHYHVARYDEFGISLTRECTKCLGDLMDGRHLRGNDGKDSRESRIAYLERK